MDRSALPPDAERAVDKIKQADIVIGIPSFNRPGQSDMSSKRALPGYRSIIRSSPEWSLTRTADRPMELAKRYFPQQSKRRR
jgi:hypothetical protein